MLRIYELQSKFWICLCLGKTLFIFSLTFYPLYFYINFIIRILSFRKILESLTLTTLGFFDIK